MSSLKETGKEGGGEQLADQIPVELLDKVRDREMWQDSIA